VNSDQPDYPSHMIKYQDKNIRFLIKKLGKKKLKLNKNTGKKIRVKVTLINLHSK
jgi:hypothetical protein